MILIGRLSGNLREGRMATRFKGDVSLILYCALIAVPIVALWQIGRWLGWI